MRRSRLAECLGRQAVGKINMGSAGWAVSGGLSSCSYNPNMWEGIGAESRGWTGTLGACGSWKDLASSRHLQSQSSLSQQGESRQDCLISASLASLPTDAAPKQRSHHSPLLSWEQEMCQGGMRRDARAVMARQGRNRGLTFQESVSDPFVLPPGISLGHLFQGLDPFETEGGRNKSFVVILAGRTSCSGAARLS